MRLLFWDPRGFHPNSTPMIRLLVLTFTLTLGAALHARDHVALLGTYTGAESRGIYAVRLNSETGALSTPELVAELSNPEFLALHPNGRFVYALTQVPVVGGKATGAVASFALDPETAHLTPLNVEPTGRGSLTHLGIDGSGRLIVAASYGDSYVVSFPVGTDGRVGPHGAVLNHEGPLGPKKDRQNAPHPHSVTLSPDSRFAVVADLSLDRMYSYRLLPDKGTIAANDPAFATFEPGIGPRRQQRIRRRPFCLSKLGE